MTTTSKRLKIALSAAGITAAELSRRTGVSNPSISGYLSGRNTPSKASTAKLAEALGVSADWLSGKDEELKALEAVEPDERNLPVKTAAKLMGIGEQAVRVGLQKGVLPFGYAIPTSGKRYVYYISPVKFYESTGIKIDRSVF